MSISLDEASRCPKCDEPGNEVLTQMVREGTAHVYHCMNQLCRWFETGWVVQEREDGSIVAGNPNARSPYPKMTPDQEAMARRYLEDIEGKDLRATGPGT